MAPRPKIPEDMTKAEYDWLTQVQTLVEQEIVQPEGPDELLRKIRDLY